MSIELILGLFGALTGFASLCIHFHTLLIDKPKIRIEIIDQKLACFFEGSHKEDLFKDPYRAIIHLRISNSSNKPISILEFCCKTKNYGTFISNQYSLPAEEYRLKETETDGYLIQVKKNQLKPIFELLPYSGKEGLIFFPKVSKINDKKLLINLIVKTTRKKFVFKKIELVERYRA